MLLIAVSVASIAVFKPGDCLGGRHDRLISVGRIAGVGNLAAADYACRENEECNACLCHKCLSGKRGTSGKAGIYYSLSRLKRCKIRWANGATIRDAILIKTSPANKA